MCFSRLFNHSWEKQVSKIDNCKQIFSLDPTRAHFNNLAIAIENAQNFINAHSNKGDQPYLDEQKEYLRVNKDSVKVPALSSLDNTLNDLRNAKHILYSDMKSLTSKMKK